VHKLEDLVCVKCGATYSAESKCYSCHKCGDIIEVRYNRDFLAEHVSIKTFDSKSDNLWKYFDLLPILKKESITSLNEGRTQLVRSHKLERNFGLKEFYLKDETRNPTGSFKDRPNTIGISKANEFGASEVAIASSGNAAASLSAYAAKAEVTCIVAVPAAVSQAKLRQIMAFGSRVVKVNGSYSNSFNLIKEACEKYGWHNLTSVSIANPYQVEGDKTVAYELFEQLNRQIPDWIVVPIGAGPLLVGIWKGFRELHELALIKKFPKMIGVQAEGCSPIVRAFKAGKDDVEPWREPTNTLALSIADPLVGYPQDGRLTLKSILDSHGIAESVNDDEMVQAVKTIAKYEGIFAEPAAAASVAVVKKLKELGKITSDDSVVSLITGTGLKSPESVTGLDEPKVIDTDLTQLASILKTLPG
jgi:threonine synthase